jgi:hypothetical protein
MSPLASYVRLVTVYSGSKEQFKIAPFLPGRKGNIFNCFSLSFSSPWRAPSAHWFVQYIAIRER